MFSATPADVDRSEDFQWLSAIEEKLEITFVDLSCNSNLLTMRHEKRVASLWSKFSELRLIPTNAVESTSDYETLMQICFDFLLVLPVRLDYVDFSYCFTNAMRATALCKCVLQSLYRRQEMILRPIDILVIQGIADFLPRPHVDKFVSDVAAVSGAIKVIV